MMNDTNVCILYGGISSEHEVSCVSAATVARTVQQCGLSLVCIGITKEGEWFLQHGVSGDEKALPVVQNDAYRVQLAPHRGLRVHNTMLDIDVVFPVLHGEFGEDGGVQALLAHCAMRYVGSDQRASAIGMDKSLAKLCWQQHQLPIVESCVVVGDADMLCIPDELSAFAKSVGYPLFVKPCHGGSSIGVTKVDNQQGLLGALKCAAEHDHRVLCERAVEGREIEFAVFDTADGQSVVTVAGEIITDCGVYDYDAKYLHPDRATLVMPAKIDASLQARMQQAARRAYEIIGCRDLARVDFLLEQDGTYYLNEINTMPGFTAQSMFPLLCKTSGYPLLDVTRLLIRRAFMRSSKSEQTS